MNNRNPHTMPMRRFVKNDGIVTEGQVQVLVSMGYKRDQVPKMKGDAGLLIQWTKTLLRRKSPLTEARKKALKLLRNRMNGGTRPYKIA